MEMQYHPLSSLFDQLGLPSSEQEIKNFIEINAPLLGIAELHKARFWNAAQSCFLKQAKEEDADWAEIVDSLDAMLRPVHIE